MDLQRKREELSRPKGKREIGGGHDVLRSFPPCYQAARTHDRTETEIDFPVGLTPQPSIYSKILLRGFETGSLRFWSAPAGTKIYRYLPHGVTLALEIAA